jgi:hypothetical protein
VFSTANIISAYRIAEKKGAARCDYRARKSTQLNPATGNFDKLCMGLHLKYAMAVIAILTLLGGVARADHIVFRDGKTLDGDITDQDGATMTLQPSSPAGAQPLVIDKSKIKSVNGIVHDGPSYILLPVQGQIGVDTFADAFKDGLQQALLMQPEYIVIFFDSPGGSIAELEKMEDVLAQVPPNVGKIAYVKRAYSAAAVLAMSCPQIYIKPDGVIGAAVPFQYNDEGLPEDVSAKFRSAHAARWRSYVVNAGHDELFLRGMMELNLDLFVRVRNGQVTLSTFGPGQVLKQSGQILTMTAQEATDCGLTQIASKIAEIGKEAVGGPWYAESKLPWHTLLDEATTERDNLINSTVEKYTSAIDLLQQRIDADQALLKRWQLRLSDSNPTVQQDAKAAVNSITVSISACQAQIDSLQDGENKYLESMNSDTSN